MKNIALYTFPALVLLFAAGCCSPAAADRRPTITVVRAAPGEIRFDGRLSEKFWSKVPAYELRRSDNSHKLPPQERARIIADGLEKASVKFAYDDKYFYAAATLTDNDIVAKGKTGRPPTSFGDAIGIFIAPARAFHYWELYSTPNGAMSAFFYELPTLDLAIKERGKCGKLPGFEIAYHLDGTLNNQSDRDRSWTTEMRIPLKDIAEKGIKFAPGEEWTIMAARYNYSSYNYAVQTSAYPQLPELNLQMRQFYAPVEFR